ncbi:MAG: ubiquinol-cytochrome c reductase iron-sulfur subunit, partial [Planctomyces sp.]
PAAAPAASAAPAPAAVVPAGLSPAEMIKAARSAESGAPVAPKVVLPTKPLPGKAAPTATKAAAEVSRRSVVGSVVATLCSPLVVAWGSFSAAAAASGLALARFMMPNVLVEPPTKFKIGPPTDYAPGTVSTKWQAQFNIWVVNSDVDGVRSIYALSTVCTHLGCTPNWLEGEQKFKCPCHGSGFYKSGINFEGPAPRPLERVGLRLAEDGMLEVDKSVKFQRELGQWTNSSSFVSTG